MLCIGSIVFLVVHAFRVITSTRRTLRSGYFERVSTLFILYTAFAGRAGLSASCKILHFLGLI